MGEDYCLPVLFFFVHFCFRASLLLCFFAFYFSLLLCFYNPSLLCFFASLLLNCLSASASPPFGPSQAAQTAVEELAAGWWLQWKSTEQVVDVLGASSLSCVADRLCPLNQLAGALDQLFIFTSCLEDPGSQRAYNRRVLEMHSATSLALDSVDSAIRRFAAPASVEDQEVNCWESMSRWPAL